jgi:hypothetical protein
MVIVPEACDEVCARMALRPPIASMWRLMMDLADGNPTAGAGAFAAGAAGAAFFGVGV